jgi:hypothetical protein
METPDLKKILVGLAEYKQYVSGQTVTKQEFIRFLDAMAQSWRSFGIFVTTSLTNAVKDTEKITAEAVREVKTQNETLHTRIVAENQRSNKALNKQIDDFMNGVSANMGYIEELASRETDLSEVSSKIDEVGASVDMLAVEEKKEHESIEQSLQELRDKIDELEKRKPVVQRGTHSAIVGRDVISDIDLSSQLNGVDKTFNIQSIYNIVSVSLSSYPYGTLRKNIDYTFTPTSITFTNTIDAETQLGAGQNCILTVVLT